MNKELSGLLYGLSASFMFALYGVFVKLLYRYQIGEYVLFLSTTFFALIFYGTILVIKNKNPIEALKIKRSDFLLSFINCGLFGLFITSIFSLMSFKYIGNGLQRSIVFSSPLVIMVLEFIFFKKKIRPYHLISLLALVLGLFIIIKTSTNINIKTGVIFAFLACFCFSIYSVIAEHHKSRINNEVYWFYACLSAFILSLIATIYTGEISHLSRFMNYKAMIYTLATSILCFAIPYYLLLFAINNIGAKKANSVVSITPILSLFNGVIFLHERTDMLQLVGFIIIFLALISLNVRIKSDNKHNN